MLFAVHDIVDASCNQLTFSIDLAVYKYVHDHIRGLYVQTLNLWHMCVGPNVYKATYGILESSVETGVCVKTMFILIYQ